MSEVKIKSEETKGTDPNVYNFCQPLETFIVAAESTRVPVVEHKADGCVIVGESPVRLELPMKKLLTDRRILLVEDEIMILMFTEYMLGDLGCTDLVSATTVNQALDLVMTQDFDAALIDVNLNGIKSYPVADALLARGVPFIFATACGGSGIDENYCNWPVLAKPYMYEELSRMLANLIPT